MVVDKRKPMVETMKYVGLATHVVGKGNMDLGWCTKTKLNTCSSLDTSGS